MGWDGMGWEMLPHGWDGQRGLVGGIRIGIREESPGVKGRGLQERTEGDLRLRGGESPVSFWRRRLKLEIILGCGVYLYSGFS